MLSLNLPEGALSDLLYAVNLFLMSETLDGLRNKLLKWKEAIESKGLKVNLGITNVMVSSGITKDGLYKSKVDPCAVCSLRVKANSVLYVECGKWIHGKNCWSENGNSKTLKKFYMQKMLREYRRQWSRK